MDPLSNASREILWNVHTSLNVIMMYALLGVALGIAGIGIWRRVELWRGGKEDSAHTGRLLERCSDFVIWALFQRGVNRERSAGIAHALIYLGFLVLLFTTTMVFLDHDLGLDIYRGRFYLALTILSDLFGLGLLIGCSAAAARRFISRPDLVHTRAADTVMLSALSLLGAQGFLLEGLRIHATADIWAQYSPVGWLVSQFFWPLSHNATSKLHFSVWWFHTLTVYAVIALAPYTKFFHIIASSLNLFFRRGRGRGTLSSPGDLEKLIEKGEEFSIGLGTIKDYSWKQLLDLDACTSCGRCQDACPAYRSGKPLSPKWIILDTRNHALTLQAKGEASSSLLPSPLQKLDQILLRSLMLPSQGLVVSESNDANTPESWRGDGSFRGNNIGVQRAVKTLGASADDLISGPVIDPAAFWSCTTCMACVEACPVGINHVEQIVGNRRNMVLMQGSIPSEAQRTLRSLETIRNPYGPPEERTKWIQDLNVRVLKPGDSVDYLYWVGCVSAFDPRKQKIARALVAIMNHAGLSFGILGSSEGCSGDPARRLGEENLFQALAKSNIEVLKSVRFKTLVANCPHCFNTIKNEYPQFGNLGEGRSPEIIHHSVLLKRLLATDSIRLKNQNDDPITFHDPCYLGRANDEYDAPREVLQKTSRLPIVEIAESRNKAMCCGAGGGHFWMDLKIGERINVNRIEQLAASSAQTIATGCPFCMQMLEDGTKLTGRDHSHGIRDLAELVAERL